MARFRFALGAAVVLGIVSGAALAAGDLSRQAPIEVTVDLGSPGKHEFAPKQLQFETGKLYKLILRNTSSDPHYFTSHAFSQMVFTRKAQVTQQQNGKAVTLAEFKGAIREIEVYPGQSAEWWLVPIAAASESHPVRVTNSTASSGFVRLACAASTAMSSSTPPSIPSSASTLRPRACARATTRLVMATFSSNGACEASIITEL